MGTIEKVLMKCSQYISSWEYKHPYIASALLNEETMAKIEKVINKALEEHGLIVDGERLPRSVTVRKIDGERFDGHLEFFYGDN